MAPDNIAFPGQVRGPRRIYLSFVDAESDRSIVKALSERLRDAGYEVIVGPEINIGTDWGNRVSESIRTCAFFIPLLTAQSVHSEMMREEARLAHESRLTQCTARLLPVRVDYDGPLGYALEAWINPQRWATWKSPADTERLVRQILNVAEGLAEPPPPGHLGTKLPAASDTLSRPVPMADLTSINAPGGTLIPDDPFYIEHTADRELRRVAHRLRETVVIKGPRQLGKSSALVRYLAECERIGKRTVLIDMSLLSSQDLSDYSSFLSSCAAALVDGLGLGSPTVPVNRQAEMNRLMREQVLKGISGNLVVAFDEADRVLGQQYQSDFFSLVRVWCNQRSNFKEPDWARLELALVISTEPYLLISDADRSPFNIGVTVELRPFDAAECRELNRRYHDLLSSDQTEALRQDLLGGHPFLTRLAYYVLSQPDSVDFNTLFRDAHHLNGPFGDHLRALLAKLRRHHGRDLVADLRQLIEVGRLPNDDAYHRLHGAGLVRRDRLGIVPANGLYTRFFGSLP
jgi:AAA-like domain/TIR domain